MSTKLTRAVARKIDKTTKGRIAVDLQAVEERRRRAVRAPQVARRWLT